MNTSEKQTPEPGGQRTRGLVRVTEKVAGWVLGVVSVVALVLFLVTGSWLWFFLIPLTTILIYGVGGSHDAR